jgi:hypothetical protein
LIVSLPTPFAEYKDGETPDACLLDTLQIFTTIHGLR